MIAKTNKKGVFGLTSVQAFFVIILGVALLAYVIVVIMGTLQDASIISKNTVTGPAVNNETTTTTVNETGIILAIKSTYPEAVCTVSACRNATDAITIPTTNYTATASTCQVKTSFTSTPADLNNTIWRCDYKYTRNVNQIKEIDNVVKNVSSGVSGFFSSINPVYAILAILVIILVLVVLVRVVTGGQGGSSMSGGRQESPL